MRCIGRARLRQNQADRRAPPAGVDAAALGRGVQVTLGWFKCSVNFSWTTVRAHEAVMLTLDFERRTPRSDTETSLIVSYRDWIYVGRLSTFLDEI